MSESARVALIVAALLIAGLSGILGMLRAGGNASSIAVGELAAPVRLELLDGGHLDLAAEAGRRVVVLNFFATWCGPCRSEMPELTRYARSLAPSDVRFVGVNLGEQATEVREFLQPYGTGFPAGIDADESIARRYGIATIPTTVVIDGKGTIVYRRSGAIHDVSAELAPAVSKAVSDLRASQG